MDVLITIKTQEFQNIAKQGMDWFDLLVAYR
jgi:hypothetical protein